MRLHTRDGVWAVLICCRRQPPLAWLNHGSMDRPWGRVIGALSTDLCTPLQGLGGKPGPALPLAPALTGLGLALAVPSCRAIHSPAQARGGAPLPAAALLSSRLPAGDRLASDGPMSRLAS